MKSVYHILNAAPIIERENIQLEYEQLAQELINSGRLRIDTNYYSNFARYTDKTTGINVILSNAEQDIGGLDLSSLGADIAGQSGGNQ